MSELESHLDRLMYFTLTYKKSVLISSSMITYDSDTVPNSFVSQGLVARVLRVTAMDMNALYFMGDV